MAWKPCGHWPVRSSAKATWSRWLALSVFCPSQQPAKSRMRTSRLPSGHNGYLSVNARSSNPVHVHRALAFARPFVTAFASPVAMRRNRGIAVTVLRGLPRNSRRTSLGSMMLPMLPSARLCSARSELSSPLRSRRTGQK